MINSLSLIFKRYNGKGTIIQRAIAPGKPQRLLRVKKKDHWGIFLSFRDREKIFPIRFMGKTSKNLILRPENIKTRP